MIKIVARWTRCGQGELEQDLDFMTAGDIIDIQGHFAEELIMDRNTDVEETGLGELLVPEEPLWPTRTYYLYYMYHPDSSYKTVAFDIKEEDGEQFFVADVRRSDGGCFPAFWSEVIIFRLT